MYDDSPTWQSTVTTSSSCCNVTYQSVEDEINTLLAKLNSAKEAIRHIRLGLVRHVKDYVEDADDIKIINFWAGVEQNADALYMDVETISEYMSDDMHLAPVVISEIVKEI